jgi:HD-like signal output (HDOD) protein
MDPALTARLIQVANSPAFKGRSRIESCRDAITRLGQSTTRDLVISFVLKGIFRSREPDLQQRMEAVWRHSTKVAAISFALARRIPDLDAGQAMLAGLMHDIGVIPVLIGAERHPALAQDRVMLDQLVKMLRADCGAMMLQKWGFGEEFIDVARHSDDWQYDSGGEPGYSDVVIIAQMHSHIGTPRMAEIPRIDTVPAFRKMMLGEVGPSLSLQVIEEAREEIGAMQQLLQ